MIAELIGVTATIISGGLDIPQVYKTWKTKDVESFSLTFLIMRWLIMILWFFYGFVLNDLIFITCNIICFTWTTIMLIFYFIYKKKG